MSKCRPDDLPGAQARELRRVIQVVYEVFFGVDYRTGEPTAFYQEHGAAPIAGMDPAQLTQQATQASQAQQAVAQNAETSLGFLRDFCDHFFKEQMIQPLQPLLLLLGSNKEQTQISQRL